MTLGADFSSFGLSCFAVGGSLAVIGFFQLALCFGHGVLDVFSD